MSAESTRQATAYLAGHSAHDYAAIVRRWKSLARRSRLFQWRTFWRQGGIALHVLRSVPEKPAVFYASAGIHGDEPAGPWGLLEWAELAVDWLRRNPAILFPCLNPWGLMENRRTDRRHRDLNRAFHRRRFPFTAGWTAVMRNERIPVALSLHEDYDGRGLYVYDLNRKNDHRTAGEILARCATPAMPVDRRRTIDGLRARRGVIARQRVDSSKLPGTPEAVHLYLEGYARRTLTFETPSEFALYDRVGAHRNFVGEVIDRLLG